MLDKKWVREHPEVVREAARRKHLKVEVDAYLQADQAHRELLTRVETLRGELKQASKKLGKMSPEERQLALAEQKQTKASLKSLEAEESQLRQQVQELALLLPMPPSPEVPDGKDDRENVELRRQGEVPEFPFPAKSHVEIGEALGILDIPRGVKLAGTRNYLLLGAAAQLEQAILRLAIEHMESRGFVLCSVPTLVNDACMTGTGYFPGGEEQAYRCEKDQLNLVGTSEVSLTAIHSGEVLNPEDLPLRRIACSPCYRREAGTYGKDTKGLYRVHQFWKVEQVVIGPNDEAWSKEEHLRMLAHATDFMDALKLPYRVVNVCAGDLGQGQVQKFDIETWMPSRQGYGETHSASRFHDFQTRRLNLRYRPEGGGKPEFCHSLNNTVVASPRILIAVMENYQQEDGRVKVPDVLQPHLQREFL
ncbi:MAG: serine--tRNA ligase [Planctomycetota bacterium]|nr:MAG: serine--tRNA ligase [Planctomycetota bacterium]